MWVRYDDRDSEFDDVAKLSDAAYRLRCGMVEFCQRLQTGGALTDTQVDGICRRLKKSEKVLQEVVASGLVAKTEGGYEVVNHVAKHDRPPAKDATGAERKRRQREREAIGAGADPSVTSGVTETSDSVTSHRDNGVTYDRDVTVTSRRDIGVTSRSHARAPTRPDPTRPEIDTAALVQTGAGGEAAADSQSQLAELARVAASLTAEELLKRFRATVPNAESRLRAALASARGGVYGSQAAYLRPFMLRVLRGEEPEPIAPMVAAPSAAPPSRPPELPPDPALDAMIARRHGRPIGGAGRFADLATTPPGRMPQ